MHTPKKKGGPASNTGTALRQNESLQIPAHGHARKSEFPPGLALARPDPGPWPMSTLIEANHIEHHRQERFYGRGQSLFSFFMEGRK
jgi:hypothetical protein